MKTPWFKFLPDFRGIETKKCYYLGPFWFLIFLAVNLLIVSPHAVLAQGPTGELWVKTYGGATRDSAFSVQETSDGGYIVAGGTYSFGAGDSDAWIVKLDSNGSIVWQKTYGNTFLDRVYSIQETSDGRYIATGFTSENSDSSQTWVLKLKNDGTIAWQKSYDDVSASSIQEADDGGYIVAKNSTNRDSNVKVLKLNTDGGVVWDKIYGLSGSAQKIGKSIQKTSYGGYILAGNRGVGSSREALILRINGDGTIADWVKSYGGSGNDEANSIQETSDGGYIVAGHTSSFGAGGWDAWIVKLDSNGSVVWQKAYGSTGTDDAKSIQETNDGAYIVAGQFGEFGTGDAWIFKISSDGNIIWQKTYGSNISIESIQQTNDGGYIVAGTNFFEDFWVAKLNSNGEIPGCGNIVSSNAAMTETLAIIQDYSADIQTSSGNSNDTLVSSQETMAEVEVICQASTYSISGWVTDENLDPLPGVIISADAGANATTDASGVYTLTGLIADYTYTITPSKSGYTFSPISRMVSVPNATEQNFTVPFLDLPLVYDGTTSTFAKILQNWNDKGRVTSWFDHKYPNYSKNDDSGIWLYNYRTITNPPDDRGGKDDLICFQKYCYDGHNGIDFGNNGNGTNEDILAAASGVVSEVCEKPPCVRGASYGKYVLIKHRQTGYATFYAHLDKTFVTPSTQVSKSDPIGKMGGTGGHPVHLHFGVYYNSNHNNQWETGEEIDPYGWKLSEPDPWMDDLKGPQSALLWMHNPDVQQNILVNQQTVMTDVTGSIQAIIPANTFSSSTTLQLSHGPVAEASAQLRSTGHSFWLRILELLLGNNSNSENITVSQATLNQPITLKITYTNTDVLHLNTTQLALHSWDDNQKIWQKSLSSVDQVNRMVTAQTQNLGDFDLQAPLICPADTLELNDDIYSASTITLNGMPVNLLFDILEDQDWFWLPAIAGTKYTIQTDNLATGVDTIIELYDTDGVTLLASDNNSGGGAASKLEWQAPQDGVYFIRIAQAPGSAYGCSASYELSINKEGGNNVYLPIILK